MFLSFLLSNFFPTEIITSIFSSRNASKQFWKNDTAPFITVPNEMYTTGFIPFTKSKDSAFLSYIDGPKNLYCSSGNSDS